MSSTTSDTLRCFGMLIPRVLVATNRLRCSIVHSAAQTVLSNGRQAHSRSEGEAGEEPGVEDAARGEDVAGDADEGVGHGGIGGETAGGAVEEGRAPDELLDEPLDGVVGAEVGAAPTIVRTQVLEGEVAGGERVEGDTGGKGGADQRPVDALSGEGIVEPARVADE